MRAVPTANSETGWTFVAGCNAGRQAEKRNNGQHYPPPPQREDLTKQRALTTYLLLIQIIDIEKGGPVSLGHLKENEGVQTGLDDVRDVKELDKTRLAFLVRFG